MEILVRQSLLGRNGLRNLLLSVLQQCATRFRAAAVSRDSLPQLKTASLVSPRLKRIPALNAPKI